jgi:amidase
MFEDAIKRAAVLDDYLAETGTTVGPLHGLPISVKDQFNVKGYDSTIGFVAWAENPADVNSTLVDDLYAAGAVIHVKTNVPVCLVSCHRSASLADPCHRWAESPPITSSVILETHGTVTLTRPGAPVAKELWWPFEVAQLVLGRSKSEALA